MALRWAGIGSPMKIGQLKPASSSSSAHRADHIPIEADRAFRIVTAHSGPGRKSVSFLQNHRSGSIRISGQLGPEYSLPIIELYLFNALRILLKISPSAARAI